MSSIPSIHFSQPRSPSSLSCTNFPQRAAWLAERATLLTNMSSLFLTAKAELARKDGVIKEARASAAAGGR